jgi:thiol:disulfide interchange protein
MRKFYFFAIVYICLILSASFGIYAEADEAGDHQGVKFEKISISEALRRAKKESKLVLLDLYAPI